MKKKYHSDKKLLSVVDQIYAAASGDLGWNKALEGVCDALGAQAADLSAVKVPAPALAGGASAFPGACNAHAFDVFGGLQCDAHGRNYPIAALNLQGLWV